jgi:hypothetical protein
MPQSGRRPQHQKQTFAAQNAMSVLPPTATAKADVCKRHVCFNSESGHVQRTSPCPLRAILVCAQQKCFRDCQAECFGRGQIDHQDELGRYGPEADIRQLSGLAQQGLKFAADRPPADFIGPIPSGQMPSSD